MKPPIVLRPEALADLEAATAWYESQLPGLGDAFLQRIEERMRAIADSPSVFPAVLESIRRAPVKRFPYGIYFEAGTERIVVLAVFHFKRSPDRLKDRT
jgi:plasmid stabilization system protein ParE